MHGFASGWHAAASHATPAKDRTHFANAQAPRAPSMRKLSARSVSSTSACATANRSMRQTRSNYSARWRHSGLDRVARVKVASQRTSGRQQLDRIDRLAEAPYFEMQLDLVGIGVAHFRNLLSLGYVLAFLHQQLAIMSIDAQKDFIVFYDHELSESADAFAAIQHPARRTGDDRLSRLAADADALEIRGFVKGAE